MPEKEEQNGREILSRIALASEIMSEVADELRSIHQALEDFSGGVVDGSIMSIVTRLADGALDGSLALVGVIATVMSPELEDVCETAGVS